MTRVTSRNTARDHRFSAGYPSFKKEGAVFWAGDIRPVPPEANCDLDKSAPVPRGRIKESRRAIRIGGVGCANAILLRLTHGTRLRADTARAGSGDLVRYPRHVKRGEPRTGCGIPETVIGLAACCGLAVDVGSDPVAVCCPGDCPNELATSGVPGSGGRPPRPPALNELLGRPPRAAQTSRNSLLTSNKVPGRTTMLISVFGAAMTMLPATLPEAVITLSGVRMS
jgi:hypothetical protein